MKNRFLFITCMLAICLCVISAGCVQAPSVNSTATPGSPADNSRDASNETLVAFVSNAAAFAKTHGTERALAEFNNRNGSFVRGDLYIFAYGFNGTTLAHPINPEAVGKPREGANAVFVREMGASVRNGSGFYRYVYKNPWNNSILESKMGYGVKVADDWWVGSGVYTGPVAATGTTPPQTTVPAAEPVKNTA